MPQFQLCLFEPTAAGDYRCACGTRATTAKAVAYPCRLKKGPLVDETQLRLLLPSRGVGDSFAKFASAIGIPPCGGCKQRQALLNKLLPYKQEDSAAMPSSDQAAQELTLFAQRMRVCGGFEHQPPCPYCRKVHCTHPGLNTDLTVAAHDLAARCPLNLWPAVTTQFPVRTYTPPGPLHQRPLAGALRSPDSQIESQRGYGNRMRLAKMLAEVTFGITAFERPRHLERLVTSILKYYPDARIVVADNGTEKADLPAATKRIGFDLDGTIYAHPKEFKAAIERLTKLGHKCYLITWHSREGWEHVHRSKVAALGIDPDLLDPSLLRADADGSKWPSKYHWKAQACDRLDFAFDDEWREFQPLTKTPVSDPGLVASSLLDLPAVRVKLLDVPYDCGLSEARHAIVQQLDTPYLLLLEEDFVFTVETRIEPFIDILEHDGQLGAVGGSVRVDGVVDDYATDLNLFRGALEGTRARDPLRFSPGGTPYRICDQHNNFGLWRREMLDQPDHSWDGLPKVGEHAAYFWRLKLAARWRVAQTPAVVVDHDRSGRSDNYLQHRARAGKLQNEWFAAQGIPGGYKPAPALAVRRNLPAPPERPNVVVLGVGHSGTSILAKMLFAAGWQAGDADAEYGESVSVRELNKATMTTGTLDAAIARDALAAVPEPWAIKDPRFCFTLSAWLPHLAALPRPPLLLWIRREQAAVVASYRRRGELRGKDAAQVLGEQYATCQRLFTAWPWAKLAIDYEQLVAATALFQQPVTVAQP